MSKHKKTRQQKIIAKLRRKLQSTARTTYQSPSSSENKEVKKIQPQFKNEFIREYKPKIIYQPISSVNETKSYSFLIHDLRKTSILTGSILFTEIMLFLLLKNRIINIPLVNF